ncbi:MAG: hypothetical protein BMS9Abin13_500 [Patescibacteria group bacterium]|nr:MAG: hypothetical protein BMS9Abin13_500 [Patescibacteria group bacterium]
MHNKLNVFALANAAAAIAALGMLTLGVLGNLRIYTGAVEMMQQWHLFFSLDVVGIIAGMIEGAVISFVFAYLFGLAYNKLARE